MLLRRVMAVFFEFCIHIWKAPTLNELEARVLCADSARSTVTEVPFPLKSARPG